MEELNLIYEALSEIIMPEFLEEWLDEHNSMTGGMTPRDLIDSGDLSSMWDIIYKLRGYD